MDNKLKETLNFISDYIQEHNYSPSIRDIANHFGKAPSTIFLRVFKLEEAGYITTQNGISRSIVVIKKGD